MFTGGGKTLFTAKAAKVSAKFAERPTRKEWIKEGIDR
jgi:hypothetical protein